MKRFFANCKTDFTGLNDLQLCKENVIEYLEYMFRFYKVKVDVFITSHDELLIYLEHKPTGYNLCSYVKTDNLDSELPRLIEEFECQINYIKRRVGILC